MSDSIKHECAVSMLRLRRSIAHYVRKYGTPFYGYEHLALLLEKQHNRGQDGAGIGCIRLDPVPGEPCFSLEKSNRNMPLADLLERIGKTIPQGEDPLSASERRNHPFCGELYLGHLRYGTFGRGGLEACHPFVRPNSCLNRTLLLAGNFNLTDTRELFAKLIATGHHPASRADGYLILQMIGHCLEKALDRNPHHVDLAAVLREACGDFDGAFTLCGMLGDGTGFAIRDAAGIRPGYFYFDDEVAVVSSERPAIQAAFDCTTAEVSELPPGEALIISRDGNVEFRPCLDPKPLRRCVFERIYFSRPNDADIHRERRALGRKLVPAVLRETGKDFENTLFSYIPNTAQASFHGLLDTLNRIACEEGHTVRFGQIAIKDAKFRTFIADAASRKEFYMHIYDVTYGLVRPGSDTLVALDDSIVRGNTLRNAILPIFDRLSPKKIVIASAAPPIKYPDCYGIDMASLKELVAFEAAVDLLRERGNLALLEQCYENAKRQLTGPAKEMTNCVRPVYEAISDADLSRAIAARLKPEGMRADFAVVFQTCEDLAECCPEHTGNWYFTGDYPTPGGFRVVNRALVNYIEHIDARAY
ncbi:class II glutamine amidotransferase [uncultured Victivallis sp.]|uniref:class II glutamine amidotransferase n=1 Tax=uncultured Victivallis sp. TaxID=354118 RepID=UPI0025CED7F8|nr:class II glutamine amidotransferase [uncultured Victivallis sp.]